MERKLDTLLLRSSVHKGTQTYTQLYDSLSLRKSVYQFSPESENNSTNFQKAWNNCVEICKNMDEPKFREKLISMLNTQLNGIARVVDGHKTKLLKSRQPDGYVFDPTAPSYLNHVKIIFELKSVKNDIENADRGQAIDQSLALLDQLGNQLKYF